nr:uncharacterized protein LOC106041061 isoform X2 [Anser cygnoides]
MRFLLAQPSSPSRYLGMAAQPSGVSATPPSFVSSADLPRVCTVPSSRSLMTTLNRTGPSTDSAITNHHWPHGTGLDTKFRQIKSTETQLPNQKLLLKASTSTTARARNEIASSPRGLTQCPRRQWGETPSAPTPGSCASCGEAGELSWRVQNQQNVARLWQTLIGIQSSSFRGMEDTSKRLEANVYMEQGNEREHKRRPQISASSSIN